MVYGVLCSIVAACLTVRYSYMDVPFRGHPTSYWEVEQKKKTVLLQELVIVARNHVSLLNIAVFLKKSRKNSPAHFLHLGCFRAVTLRLTCCCFVWYIVV